MHVMRGFPSASVERVSLPLSPGAPKSPVARSATDGVLGSDMPRVILVAVAVVASPRADATAVLPPYSTRASRPREPGRTLPRVLLVTRRYHCTLSNLSEHREFRRRSLLDPALSPPLDRSPRVLRLRRHDRHSNLPTERRLLSSPTERVFVPRSGRRCTQLFRLARLAPNRTQWISEFLSASRSLRWDIFFFFSRT